MIHTLVGAGRCAQRALLLVVLSISAAACAAGGGASERRQVIVPRGVTPAPFYSPAVRTGELIFFSGVIGTRQGGGLAAGGIEGETRQALENLERVMNAANVRRADVVKCTVFLADIRDYDAMNAIYRDFFRSDPPARTTVGVAGLPAGARVEIECIGAAR